MNLVKHGMMYKKITRGTLNIYREIMFGEPLCYCKRLNLYTRTNLLEKNCKKLVVVNCKK